MTMYVGGLRRALPAPADAGSAAARRAASAEGFAEGGDSFGIDPAKLMAVGLLAGTLEGSLLEGLSRLGQAGALSLPAAWRAMPNFLQGSTPLFGFAGWAASLALIPRYRSPRAALCPTLPIAAAAAGGGALAVGCNLLVQQCSLAWGVDCWPLEAQEDLAMASLGLNLLVAGFAGHRLASLHLRESTSDAPMAADEWL